MPSFVAAADPCFEASNRESTLNQLQAHLDSSELNFQDNRQMLV